ncbi:hypothetical protein NIES4071_00620 [Calothrix sp. NIES-4071]|nr:hypothetical protein NIES4071_00620 [Calothrix sp. NIES-4071]BAZ54408.1 hypothetical protein NIES4105_00610 [Calothrix sp. NIES-4105]
MKKLAILGSAIALTLLGNAVTFAKVASTNAPQHSLYNVSTKVVNPEIIIAQADNMTGAWNCNDGGVYFIRQVGNQIWWYGQSSDGGQTWSNVFQGTITGSRIIGSWADVPKGSIRGYGEMTLRISGGRIQKISGGENFGGSVWSR